MKYVLFLCVGVLSLAACTKKESERNPIAYGFDVRKGFYALMTLATNKEKESFGSLVGKPCINPITEDYIESEFSAGIESCTITQFDPKNEVFQVEIVDDTGMKWTYPYVMEDINNGLGR